MINLIYSFLDSLHTNHIYVVYNIIIYIISELFNSVKDVIDKFIRDNFK